MIPLLKSYKRFLRSPFKRYKLLLWWGLGLFGVTLIAILAGNLWIVQSRKTVLFDSITALPANDVGLLLGTSRWLADGQENLFFRYRVDAAFQLYKAGKIKHILVSGDNSQASYNEPREMYRALTQLGIPQAAITLDYAGFRTLDSVVRSREIFQQQRLTIISQRFHNYRALFIADYYGIDAVAYNAREVKTVKSTYWREILARIKAILDLYILKTKPKFLGEKITIPIN